MERTQQPDDKQADGEATDEARAGAVTAGGASAMMQSAELSGAADDDPSTNLSPAELQSRELRASLEAEAVDPTAAFAGAGGELPHRAQMEAAFGADLSGVEAHTGQSGALGAMGADGAAHGEQVAFAETDPGPGVVAHEVAHVMQHRTHGGGGGVATHALVSRPSDAGEVEADAAASAVTAGRAAPPIKAAAPAGVARSFISFALKASAKQGTKAMLRNFIKTRIKTKIRKVMDRQVAKRFAKEADEILGVLTDPWWATAIGFIPIVGDVFDLARVPMQIRRAIKKADTLEETVKKTLAVQKKVAPGLRRAAPGVLGKALAKFRTITREFGGHAFKLDKKGMQHILERHHPKYWNGTIKSSQSFFKKSLSVDDIGNIATKVMEQNVKTLTRKGSSGMYQVEGTVNGVKYVLGLNRGRVGQLYPL